jgi:hypothetical protein
MRYIDAGYTIVLGVLACYAGSLFWRRRRLERIAARLTGQGEPGPRRDGR